MHRYPTKNAVWKKASKKDIARIEYLHVDADPADDETPQTFKARMHPKIVAFPQPPTFVLDSGNGVHLLWRLQQPVELTGAEVIADVEARNHALAVAFGADPSTRNIDRILRLPRTVNYPSAHKRELGRSECEGKLLKIGSLDAAYPLDAFPPWREPDPPPRAGPNPSELPANLRTLLLTEEAGGYPSRHELVFAFLTGAIRAGIADAVMVEACLDPQYAGKGIYEHIREQGGRAAAERQLRRAHAKIGSSGSISEPIHDWDDPDPSILDDRRGDLPEFPLDQLASTPLRDWAKSAAHGTGTSVDHVVVPLLAAPRAACRRDRTGSNPCPCGPPWWARAAPARPRDLTPPANRWLSWTASRRAPTPRGSGSTTSARSGQWQRVSSGARRSRKPEKPTEIRRPNPKMLTIPGSLSRHACM
jgi:hypothetical protein